MITTRLFHYAVDSVDDVKKRGLSCRYHILINGLDAFSGTTEEEYKLAGKTILTDGEFHNAVKAWEDSMIGDWCEETEEDYEYSMNVLPPVKWYSGGFYVPEAFSGDMHSFHQKFDGKYFTSLQRIGTERDKIIDSLVDYINKTFHEKY